MKVCNKFESKIAEGSITSARLAAQIRSDRKKTRNRAARLSQKYSRKEFNISSQESGASQN